LVEKSDERWCEAEIYRRQGELLSLEQGTRKAEEAFKQAMRTARKQGARMLELRAGLGLGHTWLKLGNYAQVKSMLEPLYINFQEGQDTCELQEACQLLEEVEQKSGNLHNNSPEITIH
jgi:predicted ATPase